jgi:hypothetical protein
MPATPSPHPTPVLPVRTSPILVTLAVLLAACGGSDSAASNPPAADAVATEAAPPADASMPTSAGVAAVPLTGPLVADVSLPFGHHVLLDRTDDVGPVSQRTRTLETVETPFADALAAITQTLTAAGFSTTDDQTVEHETTPSTERPQSRVLSQGERRYDAQACSAKRLPEHVRTLTPRGRAAQRRAKGQREEQVCSPARNARNAKVQRAAPRHEDPHMGRRGPARRGGGWSWRHRCTSLRTDA